MVWPIKQVTDLHTEHYNLESILIATEDEPSNPIEALATIGLKISIPPRHIFNLLGSLSKDGLTPKFLTPASAHVALNNQVLFNLFYFLLSQPWP